MSSEQVLDIDLEEGRYHRLELIPWWDQQRLFDARVMVVGAGALGNEILKQLALLGVGNIYVVDMDTIEESNLTRAVLFREKDEGQPKAEVAACAVAELNPDIKVQSFVGNVVYDLGEGIFRDMDIVLSSLDNREARVAINQSCWKLNKPFVDGAIEVIQGVARIFWGPEGPCYECTMNEKDYELLSQRRSCAMLSRDDIVLGHIPTTPTTASVIAGIQTQEAIKWLHRDRQMPTDLAMNHILLNISAAQIALLISRCHQFRNWTSRLIRPPSARCWSWSNRRSARRRCWSSSGNCASGYTARSATNMSRSFAHWASSARRRGAARIAANCASRS